MQVLYSRSELHVTILVISSRMAFMQALAPSLLANDSR